MKSVDTAKLFAIHYSLFAISAAYLTRRAGLPDPACRLTYVGIPTYLTWQWGLH